MAATNTTVTLIRATEHTTTGGTAGTFKTLSPITDFLRRPDMEFSITATCSQTGEKKTIHMSEYLMSTVYSEGGRLVYSEGDFDYNIDVADALAMVVNALIRLKVSIQ